MQKFINGRVIIRFVLLFSFFILLKGCVHDEVSSHFDGVEKKVSVNSNRSDLGSVCLGRIYSKAPLRGGYEVNIDGVSFKWDPQRPAFIKQKFPVDKPLSVKINVNGIFVEQIFFKIHSKYANTITIYRSAGYFRAVQNSINSCSHKTLGYELNKKSGELNVSYLRCYDYKVRSAKAC